MRNGLKRFARERPAVRVLARFFFILVEHEQQIIRLPNDARGERDFLFGRAIELLLEDAQSQIVVRRAHFRNPVIGQDARRCVRLPQIPRLLRKRPRFGQSLREIGIRLHDETANEPIARRFFRRAPQRFTVLRFENAHAKINSVLSLEVVRLRARIDEIP